MDSSSVLADDEGDTAAFVARLLLAIQLELLEAAKSDTVVAVKVDGAVVPMATATAADDGDADDDFTDAEATRGRTAKCLRNLPRVIFELAGASLHSSSRIDAQRRQVLE